MKISFNKNKTTALTYLLTKIFEWIDKIMNKSGEIRRWVHHKYVMSQIIQKIYALKKNCSYLAVTEIFRLNQRNDELYWWIMKVRASKIWNESNHTKNSFNKKTALTLLLPRMFNWIKEKTNGGDEVRRWVHQKCNDVNHTKLASNFKNCSYLDVTDTESSKKTHDPQYTKSNNNNW